MKKITNNINVSQLIKIIYLLIVILYISKFSAYADSGPSDPGVDPDSAPIDGGLSLLIAGGVGYGVKKLRKKKKKQQEELEK